MAEVSLPPGSQLIGKSILELAFRTRFGLNVVGLRREQAAIEEQLVEEKLRLGDTLLVVGPWKAVRQLQSQPKDFLVLSLPAEIDQVAPARTRAPQALLSLAVMVGLMVTGAVPNVIAALIGCLLMGAGRCIDMNSAYRAIHWQSLVLIVGMLPFALALQKTGGITLAVDALVAVLGDAGPYAVLASLFLLTAVTGLFISNTATAVLIAPVAIATARAMDAAPEPFAMIVALAASAAFMTPISSPVNTLVLGPGRYRFGDFVRIGVPFTILVMIVSVLLVPLLLPL
ncbi:Citrate transporter [compost metagenome]